jgi:hypothetical protein
MRRAAITTCLALAICCAGCKGGLDSLMPHRATRTISVVGNGADDVCAALQFLDADGDGVYDGYAFRFRDASGMGEARTFSVPPENSLFASRSGREASLESFRGSVTDALTGARRGYGRARGQARTYKCVAAEANYLSRCRGPRTLILYGDCLNSAGDLDLSNPIVMSAVTNHPEQAIDALGGVMGIGPLRGVRVYIICLPEGDDERHYMAASEFYRQLLAERGAQVEVVSGLTETIDQ